MAGAWAADAGRTGVDLHAAATHRVSVFLAELERLGSASYERLSLGDPDTEGRLAARATAYEAAESSGLARIMDDARSQAGAIVTHALVADPLQPIFIGLHWGRATSRPADQVAVVAAVEDAATAAVVQDVVPAAVVDQLNEAFETIRSWGPDDALAARRPDRSDRTARVAMFGVLALFVLGAIVVAGSFGAVAVAIPVVMAIVIVFAATRQRLP